MKSSRSSNAEDSDGSLHPECPTCGQTDMVTMEPEAGYWYCRRCGERGSGTEEPIWWRNDPDSAWYVEDEDEEVRV